MCPFRPLLKRCRVMPDDDEMQRRRSKPLGNVELIVVVAGICRHVAEEQRLRGRSGRVKLIAKRVQLEANLSSINCFAAWRE